MLGHWSQLFIIYFQIFKDFLVSTVQPSWVTDEEFGMGYLELKPSSSVAMKPLGGSGAVQNGTANFSQNEIPGGKAAPMTTHPDSGHLAREQASRAKPADASMSHVKFLGI